MKQAIVHTEGVAENQIRPSAIKPKPHKASLLMYTAKRQTRRSRSRQSASFSWSHLPKRSKAPFLHAAPLLHAAPEIEIKRLSSLQLHVQLRWLLAAAPVSRKGFVNKAPTRACDHYQCYVINRTTSP